jgi:hypothetical protein
MPDLDPQTRATIEQAICDRKKIEAIKLYREAVPGTDLVEAKNAVEAMEAQLRKDKPENFGPPASKTGCLGMVLALTGSAAGLVAVGLACVCWD